jgi:hypothetical protein
MIAALVGTWDFLEEQLAEAPSGLVEHKGHWLLEGFLPAAASLGGSPFAERNYVLGVVHHRIVNGNGVCLGSHGLARHILLALQFQEMSVASFFWLKHDRLGRMLLVTKRLVELRVHLEKYRS